ncbi:MAG: Nif3-like dinuclear metal center hexameric protein [Elusimicrobiota bacterium]
MDRDKLVNFIDGVLESYRFKDSSKNGLQVEGKREVKKAVFSPSISLALIKKAVEYGADAIIVHHGLLWGKEESVTGVYAQKLHLLLSNGINLMAWHIPLDAHKVYGNNVNLIKHFPVNNIKTFGEYDGNLIGFKGRLRTPIFRKKAEEIIREKINSKALFLPFGPEKISSIGVVSGGGQSFISQAAREKLDLYITGEASEYCFEAARESGLNFSAAGHYATEKAGVQALKKLLEKKFHLKTFFYDSSNPI